MVFQVQVQLQLALHRPKHGQGVSIPRLKDVVHDAANPRRKFEEVEKRQIYQRRLNEP